MLTEEDIYKENKDSKVGTAIICPTCGTIFIKRQYNQAFDSIKCKNQYWNVMRGRNKSHSIDMSDCDRFLGDDECESFSNIYIDSDSEFDD